MLLFRVAYFGEARGPWRRTRRKAEADAIDLGLGTRDEYGRFYLDAGAELAWMHENEMARLAAARPALNMKTPARESQPARLQA